MPARRSLKVTLGDDDRGSISAHSAKTASIAHRKHKRSSSVHSSWLRGLGSINGCHRNIHGQQLGPGNHESNARSQRLVDAVPGNTAIVFYQPYYMPVPCNYRLRAAHPHLSRTQAQEPTARSPPVRARRFMTCKSGIGPYEWTLPHFLCRTGYSPGVLIRRFFFWLENDRTQFEGFERRAPGELTHWKTHGPSKLRNVICSSDEDESQSTVQDERSRGHDAPRTGRFVGDGQSAPFLKRSTATSHGSHRDLFDDSHSFCASTMDLDELASLFKDEPQQQSRGISEVNDIDVHGAESLKYSRVQGRSLICVY